MNVELSNTLCTVSKIQKLKYDIENSCTGNSIDEDKVKELIESCINDKIKNLKNELNEDKVKELIDDELSNDLKNKKFFNLFKNMISAKIDPDITTCTELKTDKEINETPLALIFNNQKFYLGPANYYGKIDWEPISKQSNIYRIMFTKDLFFRRIREMNIYCSIDPDSIIYDDKDYNQSIKSQPFFILDISIIDFDVLKEFLDPSSKFHYTKFFNTVLNTDTKKYAIGSYGEFKIKNKIDNSILFSYDAQMYLYEMFKKYVATEKIKKIRLKFLFQLNIIKNLKKDENGNLITNYFIESIDVSLLYVGDINILGANDIKFENDSEISYSNDGPQIEFNEPNKYILYDKFKFAIANEKDYDVNKNQNFKIPFTIKNLKKNVNYKVYFELAAFDNIDDNDYVILSLDQTFKIKRDSQNHSRLYVDPQNYTISKEGYVFNKVLPFQKELNTSTVWTWYNHDKFFYEFEAKSNSIDGYFEFVTNKPMTEAAWAINLTSFKVVEDNNVHK